MLPLKSRLELSHTLPDDRDFSLSVYMRTNDNGDALCMTKTPTQNKIWKNKRKKISSTNRGAARMKNQGGK